MVVEVRSIAKSSEVSGKFKRHSEQIGEPLKVLLKMNYEIFYKINL